MGATVRKKKLSKHAAKRAALRYGNNAGQALINECVKRIVEQRDAYMLFAQTNTRKHYLVNTSHGVVYCVYNSALKTIMTFLDLLWIPQEHRNRANQWLQQQGQAPVV